MWSSVLLLIRAGITWPFREHGAPFVQSCFHHFNRSLQRLTFISWRPTLTITTTGLTLTQVFTLHLNELWGFAFCVWVPTMWVCKEIYVHTTWLIHIHTQTHTHSIWESRWTTIHNSSEFWIIWVLNVPIIEISFIHLHNLFNLLIFGFDYIF